VTARPLDGRTVVVTRASVQAGPFVDLLRADGARVIEAPTITIEPPESWVPLDTALDDLARYTWVVFTSVNGVAMVDRRLRERGHTWAPFVAKRVAAIGPATGDALAEHGLRTDVVPHEFRAEGLIDCLRGELHPDDVVLLPRAARTRDILVRELRALASEVTEVPAYSTRRVQADSRVWEALAGRRVDVVSFTSSSTARNFVELFSEDERRTWLAGVAVAAIGPITAATAAAYGLETTIVPVEYTIPALARAIAQHFAGASSAGAAAEPTRVPKEE
jgi:uroporphyrinogen III methyltransferase/synthase